MPMAASSRVAGAGDGLSQGGDHVGDDGVGAVGAAGGSQVFGQQLAAVGDDDGEYLRRAEVDAADDAGEFLPVTVRL